MSLATVILILGLLWLLTFRAGRIVLLTVALVGGVGLFAGFALMEHNRQANVAQYERELAAAAPAKEALKRDCAAIYAKYAGHDLASEVVELSHRGCPGY
jgi:hypothetical protein